MDMSDPDNPFPRRAWRMELAFFVSKVQCILGKGREDLRVRFMGYDL